MERVIKRFLLHNNKQDEEMRESDFDEFKNSIKQMQTEISNSFGTIRNEITNYMTGLFSGLTLVNDFIIDRLESRDDDSMKKRYKSYNRRLNRELQLESARGSTPSSTVKENLIILSDIDVNSSSVSLRSNSSESSGSNKSASKRVSFAEQKIVEINEEQTPHLS